MRYVGGQVELTYDLPLSEIVVDFFDRLKSVSRGYASLDYSLDRYEESDVIKLTFFLMEIKSMPLLIWHIER